MYQTWIGSPIGNLFLAADGQSLTGLWMESQKYFPTTLDFDVQPELPVFQQTQVWLSAYWEKAPLPAMPPLASQGSPFQRAVWKLLLEIPYGETRTYKQQAESIGKPKALRAIGMANHRNPIPIFIPCHRVIGADGSLTGYGGGLQIKRTLLDLERRTLEKQRETELRKAAQ